MYNEEDNLGDTVAQLHAALTETGAYEIVLVNDGSTDRTEQVANEVAARDPAVRLVSYRPNQGRGRALRAGLEAARGEIIVATEADLSWGADIASRLTRALDEDPGVDVVVASPYMPGGKLEDVPWQRGLISRLGNKVLRLFMPGQLTMMTGMTRAYRRHVIQALELESNGKEIHIEILSKLFALGYRMKEIPATLSGRKKGQSKFRFQATALSHLAFSFLEKPMVLFGFLGVLCLLAGGVIGVGLTLQLLLTGYFHFDRPLTVLLLLLLLAGAQLLSFGFIGTQIVLLRKELYKVQRSQRKIHQELETWSHDDQPA